MKNEKHVEKYGFCPIMEPEKRKKMINLLSKKAQIFKQKRQEKKFVDFEDYKKTLEHLAQLKRIDRSEEDVLYFMYEYLSDDKNPDNEDNLVPRGVSIEDAPEFHRELCDILNVVSNKEVTKRVAWASPRGSAKSAYLSNCFPLHQTVFRKRKYILIISETDSMSKKFTEFVGDQLKFNNKLREDFGELLHPKASMNERDNMEGFLTTTGTLVESASMGKQLRGKRNGSSRPDLVLLDDMESQKNTNTAELREKNLHWFNSVVMPIGDPDRTAFVYMGTMVHANGLLPNVLNRADFQSKVFSAIISPPEREDLWSQFDEMLRDQENPNRLEDALQFYEENKIEMDKGVKVLWEARLPYYKLMIEKANMPSRAFSSEYLNNPIDIESQIFRTDSMTFYDVKELKEVEHRLEFYGAWDIAFGKSNRSDYNACIIVGRDRLTGIIYVVETWAEKCPAHIALERVLEIIKKYKPRTFAVETVQGQFDLFRQLRERMLKERVYFTNLKAITTNRSHGKKEDRIEQMEPLVESGAIRFKKQQRLLIEQLEHFPSGDHDDLPDALQMTLDLCSLNTRRSFHKKPKGL